MESKESGRKGGQAGRGEAKKRGDAEFYRRIAKKRRRHCPSCTCFKER